MTSARVDVSGDDVIDDVSEIPEARVACVACGLNASNFLWCVRAHEAHGCILLIFNRRVECLMWIVLVGLSRSADNLHDDMSCVLIGGPK